MRRKEKDTLIKSSEILWKVVFKQQISISVRWTLTLMTFIERKIQLIYITIRFTVLNGDLLKC